MLKIPFVFLHDESYNSKNVLSGCIKSVTESLIATFLNEGISNCFSPQTPVIFAWYFFTRVMLLTARRPHGRELADSDQKNCEINY